MKSELSVMEKLKEVIIRELNDYLLTDEIYGRYAEAITADNVDLGYPEPETMKKKNMFWITPDEGSLEAQTTCSDVEDMIVNITIMVKRDTNESLCRRVFAYYTALYKMLRNNSSLDGYVTFLDVDSWSFYPAVNLDGSITAIIVPIKIGFERDWIRQDVN